MTALLSILTDPKEVNDGKFYVTCVVARQFHSLTDLYKPRLPDGANDTERWRNYFDRLRQDKRRQRQEFGGEVSYLELVELEDDPFVWMCANADYGVSYIGHTGGSPPPLLPRYEFINSLRGKTPEEVAGRVRQSVERVLQALDQTKLQLDQDHNYLTNKRLVKVIPRVIYTAHEHCKALGRQLESELKSWIVAWLQEMRKIRAIRPTDVELLPVPVKAYVERYLKVIEDDLRNDPGKLIR